MNYLKLFLSLLICCAFNSLYGQYTTFKHYGTERQYIYYAPANLQENAPLVFVIHGYTGDASAIRNYSEMNDIADANGFAVCYPRGTQDQWNNRFFNVGYDFHNNQNVDDLDFLKLLALHLQNVHGLSPENTFATGLSNGGDMCYLLACQATETFKAIAPVAGMMLQDIMDDCNPTTPIPVLEIHGTDDDVTYWNGDPSNQDGWGAYPSIPDMMDFVINLNQCTDLESFNFPNISTNDGSTVVAEKHTNGINGNEVWLYTVENGGHDWPGAWGNMDIHSSQEIWWFFEKFLNTSVATNNQIANFNLEIYPNPATNTLVVTLPFQLQQSVHFTIVNSIGQTIISQTTNFEEVISIDIADLENGMYFLQSDFDNKMYSTKFIKQH